MPTSSCPLTSHDAILSCRNVTVRHLLLRIDTDAGTRFMVTQPRKAKQFTSKEHGLASRRIVNECLQPTQSPAMQFVITCARLCHADVGMPGPRWRTASLSAQNTAPPVQCIHPRSILAMSCTETGEDTEAIWEDVVTRLVNCSRFCHCRCPVVFLGMSTPQCPMLHDHPAQGPQFSTFD